jgi:hypothetical protein
MFYYSLAEKLGYISISRMLREVTSEEISEWYAFYQVREDYEKQQEVAAQAKERAKQNNR